VQEEKSVFPERLRRLRERKRMNRKVLGELCGLSKCAISRYERGVRVPDINTAMKIADVFDVSLDYLCGYEKNFFPVANWRTERL